MKRTWKTICSVIVTLALCLGLTACINNEPSTALGKAGFMSIDINPSIELIFDDNGKVASVNAKNDDAAIMLIDVTLVGMTAQEATKTITALAEKMGYLNESNTNVKILAAASSDEAERELLDSAAKGATEGSAACKVVSSSSLLSREVKQLQAANLELYKDLTPAKLRLIKAVMQLDKTAKIEELAKQTVKDLNRILQAEHEKMKDYISNDLKDKYELLEDEAETRIKTEIYAVYGTEIAEKFAKIAELDTLLENIEDQLENVELTEADITEIMTLLSITDKTLLEADGKITASSVENYLERLDTKESKHGNKNEKQSRDDNDDDDDEDEELENLFDSVEDILDRYDEDEAMLTDGMIASIKAIVGEIELTDLEQVEDILDEMEDELDNLVDDIKLTTEQKQQIKELEKQLDKIEDEIEQQMKDEIAAVKKQFKTLKQEKLEINLQNN